MWGWIPQFGHTVFFWSTLVAAVCGGIGIGAAFISAMVGYELSEWSSQDANERIKKAQADSDAKIAVAREESKAAVEKAQADIEKSRAEAAVAKLETEKLKAVVAWRTFSAAQNGDMEKILSAKRGSVNLRWMDGDPEALFFAIQISQVLQRAHWNVAPGSFKPANRIMFGLIFPPVGGDDAQTLREALSAAKVGFSAIPFNPPEGNSFSVQEIIDAPFLLVGSRMPVTP